MSNKKLGLILLIVAVLAVGAFAAFKLTANDDKPTANQASTEQPASENNADSDEQNTGNDDANSTALTAEEVKSHNAEDDCWTIISGQVYDITEYVARHPGGDEILRACGEDATSFFTQRKSPEGEEVGSGTPHSNSAESQLEQFLLGPLQ